MKTTLKILPALVLSFILISCGNVNESDSDRISGNWRWIQSVGGFGGGTFTPETEGHQQYLRFSENNDFRLTRADTVVYEGTYELKKENGELKIYYSIPEEYPLVPQIVDFNTADTLILRDECTDCYVNTYVRE